MNTKAESLNSTELNLELYRKLILARRSEEYIIKHYAEDDMKTPMHMSMGQEAIAVGVCQALGADSQIWTSYRSHAAFLAKTGDTDKFFAELYGKVTGTAAGKAGSMHLADPSRGYMTASAIVASVIAPAIGLAFANKSQNTGLISCVMFGDGALDEGVFWESLNAACVMQLPVLFVCEDNGLAVHTPAAVRQGYRSITEVVGAFDCNVTSAETTDVEEVFQITRNAIEAILATSRPVFLHLKCYRYLEHVGIYEDFDAGYRPKSEFESWQAQDCVAKQRKKLLEQGIPPEQIKYIESTIDSQIQASMKSAQEASFPPTNELYRGVFHEAD